jgi:hypothetical protein
MSSSEDVLVSRSLNDTPISPMRRTSEATPVRSAVRVERVFEHGGRPHFSARSHSLSVSGIASKLVAS